MINCIMKIKMHWFEQVSEKKQVTIFKTPLFIFYFLFLIFP